MNAIQYSYDELHSDSLPIRRASVAYVGYDLQVIMIVLGRSQPLLRSSNHQDQMF
jgi:hypothetical protein